MLVEVSTGHGLIVWLTYILSPADYKQNMVRSNDIKSSLFYARLGYQQNTVLTSDIGSSLFYSRASN